VRGVRRGVAILDEAAAARPDLADEPFARSDAPAFALKRGPKPAAAVELNVSDEGVATVPVAGRAANINLGRLDTSDDVKQVIADMAAASADEIDVARRGTMSHDLTRQLADEIGMSVDQLLARRPGQAMNAEEALAARRLLVASGENLTRLAAEAALRDAGQDTLFRFRHAVALHDAIQQEVAGLTAEAGRSLSAFRIPAGAAAQQTRAIEEALAAAGRTKITGHGALDTREMARLAQTLSDPAKLATFARQASRATTRDQLFEAWVNGLLSGPTTHAVNITSNALVALWQIPERLLAAAFRRLAGGQGVDVGEVAAQAYGLVTGAKEGLSLAAKVLRTGVPVDAASKIEVRSQAAITAANFGLDKGGPMAHAVDFIGELVRLPGRALMTEDTFFKAVGYRMELNARAWRQAVGEGFEGEAAARRMRELIADPPRDLRMAAVDASLYQTFTAPLGEGGRLLTAGVNKIPGLRLIIPFIRTPVNILKFVGVRSPLAPFASAVRADIAAGGARRDLALARITTGSLVMAMAAELSGQGLITAGGPTDPEMKAALRRTGWQPYSLKIGDRYLSYQRLDPVGMTLGLAADIAEVMGQVSDPDTTDLAAAGVLAAASNLTSKTYLSGFADLAEIFGGSGPIELTQANAERYLARLAASFVPFSAAVATAERAIDPTLRETRGGERTGIMAAANRVVQQIRSRVPGYSDELPPRRNLWGDAIVLQGGLGPDIMSPIYSTVETDSPIDREIIAHDVPIRMPSRVINGVELMPKEYDDFIRLAGNDLKDPSTGLGARDTLNAIVTGDHPLSDAYRAATDGPDGGKAVIIREQINLFRALAREQVQQDHPGLRAAITAHQSEAARALTGEPVQ
jgi:hypothetical protein